MFPVLVLVSFLAVSGEYTSSYLPYKLGTQTLFGSCPSASYNRFNSRSKANGCKPGDQRRKPHLPCVWLVFSPELPQCNVTCAELSALETQCNVPHCRCNIPFLQAQGNCFSSCPHTGNEYDVDEAIADVQIMLDGTLVSPRACYCLYQILTPEACRRDGSVSSPGNRSQFPAPAPSCCSSHPSGVLHQE